MPRLSKIAFTVLIGTAMSASAQTQFSMQDLIYAGAMRFQFGTFGDSRLGFANGSIAVSDQRNSVFIVGHSHHEAIAEYGLEEFSSSNKIEDLPMARPIQDFSKVLTRAPSGNPQGIGVITNLALIENRLVVNAAQYYDAAAENTDTTLVIEDPANLDSSEITGFLRLEGANKAAGWLTPVPTSLRVTLDADYISGHASNLPINARSSMGPSAFSIKSADILNAASTDRVKTDEILSYSIQNPLHKDQDNQSLENDIWTEVSEAHTGFIIPGTNTYAVFGNSGGHEFGIGYKIRQDDGRSCGGWCTYVAEDIYNYYWLFDVEDLLNVKKGSVVAHSVRPFEYGKFELPFEKQEAFSKPRLINGAYYDFENQFLYLLLGHADRLQSAFETVPLLLKYEINVGQRPASPTNFTAASK